MKLERRSFLSVSSLNHRSTRFGQEKLVGVKCRCHRFWRGFGQPLGDSRVLMGGVVQHQLDVEVSEDLAVDDHQEGQELTAAVTGEAVVEDLAGGGVEGGEQRRGPMRL